MRNIDGGKGARERWMGLLRLTQSKPLTHNIETETKCTHCVRISVGVAQYTNSEAWMIITTARGDKTGAPPTQ